MQMSIVQLSAVREAIDASPSMGVAIGSIIAFIILVMAFAFCFPQNRDDDNDTERK